ALPSDSPQRPELLHRREWCAPWFFRPSAVPSVDGAFSPEANRWSSARLLPAAGPARHARRENPCDPCEHERAAPDRSREVATAGGAAELAAQLRLSRGACPRRRV